MDTATHAGYASANSFYECPFVCMQACALRLPFVYPDSLKAYLVSLRSDMASVSANGMPSSNATSANATGQASPYVGTSPTVPSTSLMVSNTSDTALTLVTFGPLSACVSIPRLDNTAAPVLSNSTAVAQRRVAQQAAHDDAMHDTRMDAKTRLLGSTRCARTLSKPDRPALPRAKLDVRGQDARGSAGWKCEFLSAVDGRGAAACAQQRTEDAADHFADLDGRGNGGRCAGAPCSAAAAYRAPRSLSSFPSFAAKSKPPLAQSLPMQNESTATLVEPKTTPEDSKIDPPGYTAPVVLQAVVGSVGDGQLPVARACRSAKRVFVPLLLLAALGMVGIAVVLNSKFAQDRVGVASSALVSTDTASTSASGVSVASSFAVATSSVRRAGHASNATSADSTALPTGTLSMTRLVRRQADFFPPALAPSRSSSSESLAPTWTSTPSTMSSLVTPTPSSSAMLSSSSSPTSTFSLSTQSVTPVATTAHVASTTDVSNEARSLLVMERGSSMHRVWWVVMLDLVLWFIQRRRTRSHWYERPTEEFSFTSRHCLQWIYGIGRSPVRPSLVTVLELRDRWAVRFKSMRSGEA
ncbi:hypothetical protein L1887_47026 [Cichorium endivia]|nr:hypothetical protein L1887_47026 [Cichorium endivia]